VNPVRRLLPWAALLAGAAGAYLGILAVLAITIGRGRQPVVDWAGPPCPPGSPGAWRSVCSAPSSPRTGSRT